MQGFISLLVYQKLLIRVLAFKIQKGEEIQNATNWLALF